MTSTNMATLLQSPSKRDFSTDTEELDFLDQFIAEEGIFDLSPGDVVELRLHFLRQAVAWHLHPASPYSAYAARLGFGLDLLSEPAGLDRVPLLPSMLFKRPGLGIAHPEATDILWTTSSGTKGSISQIPRDDTTLRRFFASIGNLTNEMLGLENPNVSLLNLGPDADEAKTLWISYVMAGVKVLLPRSRNYVRSDVFKVDEVIRDLEALSGERVAVIGPPPLLLELATNLSAKGVSLRLRPDSHLITIGGWKRRSGEQIPRKEFDELVCNAFGLEYSQVRDSFNMVELNNVMFECAEKNLHVPPWLYVRARHTASLEALPSGESGVLSYLDPTPVSYPGFVLSDDLGAIHEGVACGCGRRSDILKIERRLNTMESRGCALKLDGVPIR